MTDAQAAALGIDPRLVRNYNRGDLSFIYMITLLSDHGKDFSSLDLPSAFERGIAGYQLAIGWLERAQTSFDPTKLPTHDQVLIVLAVQMDDVYKSLKSKDTLEGNDWRRIRRSVERTIGELSKKYNRAVVVPEVKELEELHQRLGEYTSVVRNAIPHRWIEGISS